MSLSSRNFVLIVFLNKLLKISMINFSSTGKSSAKEVDFLGARIVVAASFSW